MSWFKKAKPAVAGATLEMPLRTLGRLQKCPVYACGQHVGNEMFMRAHAAAHGQHERLLALDRYETQVLYPLTQPGKYALTCGHTVVAWTDRPLIEHHPRSWGGDIDYTKGQWTEADGWVFSHRTDVPPAEPYYPAGISLGVTKVRCEVCAKDRTFVTA